MATVIAANGKSDQFVEIREWLAARGGVWTRELAMAVLEGLRERSELARNAQYQQLDWMPVVRVPRPLTKPAVPDVDLAIAESLDGASVTIPDGPYEELAKSVLKRWLVEATDPLRPITDPVMPPSKSQMGAWLVAALLFWAMTR